MSRPTPSFVPRLSRPDMSEGSLSERFPEIEVTVSTSFAHNRGMTSRVESLKVAGKPCKNDEILQALVAHRQGWTTSGGNSDADVVQTMTAFASDWTALFADAGRITSETAPRGLSGPFLDIEYHPPRVAIYALDDGDKIVVHAFFKSWDGGNHGQQFAYVVQAYRVSTGARFVLEPIAKSGPSRPKPATEPDVKPAGPQPVDKNVPRPRQISSF